MLRILIKQTDFGTAAHVAGVEAHHTFKTFDVEMPEVEQYVADGDRPLSWRFREIVGIEVIPSPKTP